MTKEKNGDVNIVICSHAVNCGYNTCYHASPHEVFQDPDVDGGLPCIEKTKCEMYIPCSLVKCIEVVAK